MKLHVQNTRKFDTVLKKPDTEELLVRGGGGHCYKVYLQAKLMHCIANLASEGHWGLVGRIWGTLCAV